MIHTFGRLCQVGGAEEFGKKDLIITRQSQCGGLAWKRIVLQVPTSGMVRAGRGNAG
jgi:hypothetical protein